MDLESIKKRKKISMECPRCKGFGWYRLIPHPGMTKNCELCGGTGIAHTL